MKKLICFLFCFTCCLSFGQVQVSTIGNSFKGSGGLSLDSAGNLYIGDFGDFLTSANPGGVTTNVWKMDKQGNMTVFASGFGGASGNAFNSQGVLYQADIRNAQVYAIDQSGNKTLFLDSTLSAPVGLVFDANDNLYVCNCGNNTIRKVSPNGASTLFASGTLFKCPNGITIDHKGNLYVTNFNGHNNMIKITPAGVACVFADIPGNNNGHLEFYAPDSTFYVCSHAQSSLYKVRYDGIVLDYVGSLSRGNADGNQYSASFSRPNGIAITANGDSMYINSSVPTSNAPDFPLNPSLIRLVTGFHGLGESDDLVLKNVDFYPNPVAEQLSIKLDRSLNCKEGSLRFFSTEGKMVRNQPDLCSHVDGMKLQIPLDSLPEGIYTFRLQIDNSSIKVGSFIKSP